MILQVQFESETPLYQQIRSQIVAGIANGELEVGQQLPSVRALAADLGINLHTVNKAYSALRDDGYVIIQGRKGAIIADPGGVGNEARSKRAELAISASLSELVFEAKARGWSKDMFLELADKVFDLADERGSK